MIEEESRNNRYVWSVYMYGQDCLVFHMFDSGLGVPWHLALDWFEAMVRLHHDHWHAEA